MQNTIIRLRKGKKGRLRPGHPWIFKGQIVKAGPGARPGGIVTVVTNEDKFIGRGYYNPSSEISVRLLTFKDEAIDRDFLTKRISEAIEKRGYLKDATNARRLIFSEADGLPGLIADLYADTLVIQVFTLGMEKLKNAVLEAMKRLANPRFIYEKSDSPFRKIEGLKPVKQWIGEAGRPEVEIFEGKAKFIVDIVNGHKTGFYLDQRRSRLESLPIYRGKAVLDLFCYTGAFSVNSAIGGAKSVLGVDIKPEWLALARRNTAINGASQNAEFVQGDAFIVLRDMADSGRKFDIIILDPPSFAKDRSSIITAAKGYKELNTLAMKTLAKDGILATFSCSHNITNDIFSAMLKDSAKAAGRHFTILKRCHQDKDHPIVKNIPETEYLKGYFLRMD